jgi:tetratricopeptide (TPR) repeat protein
MDDPSRLQGNPVVAQLLAGGTDVRESLERAVMQLPKRLRVVIIRCDLARELHHHVASDLGISERHVYRLRRQALRRLVNIIANPSVKSQFCAIELDPIGLQVSYATAEENAGNFDGAIRTLEDLEQSLTDTYQRAHTACRLASACCNAGMFAAARTHLDRARALACAVHTSDSGRDLMENEIEVIGLKLTLCRGHFGQVQEHAERITQRLRALTTCPSDPMIRRRTAEVLASLLLMLVDVNIEKGAFGDALALALEARSLLERYPLSSPALRTQCLRAIADLRAFTGGKLARTVDELNAALTLAETSALPRIAVSIAGDLGGAYGIHGEVGRAIDIGTAALKLADAICFPEERVRTGVELASSYLIAHDPKSARVVLRDAAAHINADDARLAAIVQLIEADINLLEGNYYAALAIARKAKEAIESLGSHRFFGSALRIEAEAQDALGHQRAAARAINESVLILESSGHPFTLARAYRCSAKIRDRRDHRLAADDLVRMLTAT